MITFTERLDKAIRIAAWAHEQQGQHRKGTDIPYIIHPFGVMIVASEVTCDEDVLISCLLHDILEDVDSTIYSETDMQKDFGAKVTTIVKDVSKDQTLGDWHQISQGYLDHLSQKGSDEAVMVCAADKIHNITSVIADYKEVGEELWNRFSTKNRADQLWWYESVLQLLSRRLPDSPLVKRLEDLINSLKNLLTTSNVA